MSTQIVIDDADYARLQSLAKPFEDTPATVVRKLLDAFLAPSSGKKDQTQRESRGVETYGPSNIPPLSHTKLMSGKIGQSVPQKTNWDALVRLALSKSFEKYRDLDKVRRSSGANLAPGKKTSEGYKPLDDLGFSYQGVSADDAIKIIVRCARDLALTLEVEFVWRDKEGAHNPGHRGQILLDPIDQ